MSFKFFFLLHAVYYVTNNEHEQNDRKINMRVKVGWGQKKNLKILFIMQHESVHVAPLRFFQVEKIQKEFGMIVDLM